MARFSRGARPWLGRRRQRKPVSWITDLFNTSTPLDGNRTGLSLLEYDDYAPSTTTIRQLVTMKRLIIKGATRLVPATTAGVMGAYSLLQAVIVMDNEDTNDEINTAAQGEALQSGRCLYLKAHTGIIHEVGANLNVGYARDPGVEVDIDWRGNCVLKPDEVVLLVIQSIADVSSVVTAAVTVAYSRALVSMK